MRRHSLSYENQDSAELPTLPEPAESTVPGMHSQGKKAQAWALDVWLLLFSGVFKV